MIEEARESLDTFLHLNITFLKQPTGYNEDHKLTVLRQTWASLHPQYKEHDINLDVLWEGLSGASSSILSWTGWCGCCGEAPKPPTAKSFRVVVRDWKEELEIEAKAVAYGKKLSAMQKELVKSR
jgi:hypothetical protein